MATAEAPTTQIPEASIGQVEERELPRLRRCVASSGQASFSSASASRPASTSSSPTSPPRSVSSSCGQRSSVCLTQFFINMEIERYTLATGETAVSGFQRLWKPLGLLMIACAIVPNIWPAWATSAATITTFLFGGGNANAIAIGAMVLIGIALSASPVVYQTIEKFEFVKVALVLVFLVVALTTAVDGGRVRRRSTRPSPASAASPAASSSWRCCSARWPTRAPAARTTSCVQLDPRQGLRHGHVRAARGLADHRRGGGRAVGPRVLVPASTRRTWSAGTSGGARRTSSSSSRSSSSAC